MQQHDFRNVKKEDAMKKELIASSMGQTRINMKNEGTQYTVEVADTVPQKKRRHRRVPIAASALVMFGSNGNARAVPAVVSNISLSGIGIYADYSLDKGATVSVLITFISEDGRMKRDSITGTIVHANKIETLYYAGIEFDEELNAEIQPFLYPYLKQLYLADPLKAN